MRKVSQQEKEKQLEELKRALRVEAGADKEKQAVVRKKISTLQERINILVDQKSTQIMTAFANTQLDVIKVDALNVETILILDTDYSVSGVGEETGGEPRVDLALAELPQRLRATSVVLHHGATSAP